MSEGSSSIIKQIEPTLLSIPYEMKFIKHQDSEKLQRKVNEGEAEANKERLTISKVEFLEVSSTEKLKEKKVKKCKKRKVDDKSQN